MEKEKDLYLGNGPFQTLCVRDMLKTLPAILTSPESTVTLAICFPLPASSQRTKMVKLSFPRPGDDDDRPAEPYFTELCEIGKDSGF